MKLNTRFDQLDAIRGLAALSVVIGHSIITLPVFLSAAYHEAVPPLISAVTNSPLHIFWAGREAVILFFMLSGFVLSLSYFERKELPYKIYILKRICRLYIPYIVSIILSTISLYIFTPHSEITAASRWFNLMWNHIPFANEWKQMIFMLDVSSVHNINTVVWSLIYEMQVSIIFPIFAIMVRKWNWKVCFVLALIFSLLHASILRYLSFFIIGALIASKRSVFVNHLNNKSWGSIIGLISIGMVFYLHDWLFYMPSFNGQINDAISGVGAAMFIILAIGNSRLERILCRPYLLYLGRISYSLYLVHAIVLLLAVYSLKNVLTLPYIIIMIPFLSLLVAHYFYKLVELPSINLGKTIAKRGSQNKYFFKWGDEKWQ